MLEDVSGLLAFRTLIYFGGDYYSPVYGGFIWSQGWMNATCFTGGHAEVPCNDHDGATGCGFHGLWEFGNMKDFIRSIANGHCVVTLTEFAGKIVTHQRGLRAKHGKVIAILNWDVHKELFLATWQPMAFRPAFDIQADARRHFDVNSVELSAAEEKIRRVRKSIVLGPSGFDTLQL